MIQIYQMTHSDFGALLKKRGKKEETKMQIYWQFIEGGKSALKKNLKALVSHLFT